MDENSVQNELIEATKGFNLLFNDEIQSASAELSNVNNAFGRTGSGIILFLQAALGMEDNLMEKASNDLYEAEKLAENAKREFNKSKHSASRFNHSAPYDLLTADAVVGQAMTQILTESAVEMLKAVYKLNRAYKLFNNTFSSVFPGGAASLPSTPMASPSMSRQPSMQSISSSQSKSQSSMRPPSVSSSNVTNTNNSSKFSLAKRFGSLLSVGSYSTLSYSSPPDPPNNELEEFIMSGACFGFGLFGLVFSLMPPKLKKLINVFGFKSDRKDALKSLALSASYKDVHSSFAALALLFYTSSTLLLAGWNADYEHDMKMFENILRSCEERYPNGTLWILNRAKLERINGKTDKALEILGETLKPGKVLGFPQAEVILVFEYAWMLLAENKYKESAHYFLHLMTLNSWSHATYTLIAAGCYSSFSKEIQSDEIRKKCHDLYMKVPELLDTKKLGGRPMPMEQFAARKIEFWKRKQERRVEQFKKLGVDLNKDDWDSSIKISPADEMACFWNSYGKVTKQSAIKHIKSLSELTPKPNIKSNLIVDIDKKVQNDILDLDTDDELAVRDLLLGILHRAVGELEISKRYLDECVEYRHKINDDTWAPAFAVYELALLQLNECDSKVKGVENEDKIKQIWKSGLSNAEKLLDFAASGEFGSTYDLEGRQMTRQLMLKDEILTKKMKLNL